MLTASGRAGGRYCGARLAPTNHPEAIRLLITISDDNFRARGVL
jgi:hypothetical protein